MKSLIFQGFKANRGIGFEDRKPKQTSEILTIFNLNTMNTDDLDKKDFKGLLYIRDAILYGQKSPTLRAIAKHMGYLSPRSASLLLERLENAGYVQRTPGGNLRLLKEVGDKSLSDRTIDIPLVGAVPCGIPLLAEENIEAMIPVSQRIAKPGAEYFLLRALGDSMNLAGINDKDILLVRRQPVAENGQRIVALIGDEATVKEFQRKGDHVVLMPRSKNPSHKPIILAEDFMVQGVVVTALPNFET